MRSNRKRQSLRVKGSVAEATYYLPFVTADTTEAPTHVMDDFRFELLSRGLEMYGKPVVEMQREMFEHGDNVRIASFVRKK
jgi:hypothetical protein